MSSILKALRKLEEEKARRHEGSSDIARDILSSGPRRKQSVSWAMPALVAALVIVAGLAGYGLLGGLLKAPSPDNATRHSPSSAGLNAPAALPNASGRDSDGSGEPLTDGPDGEIRPSGRLADDPSGREGKDQTLPATRSREETVQPVPKMAPRGSSQPVPAQETKVDSVAAPLPALLLSGIAFQEERDARLAVVNDLPVMEGTMMGGAKVEEILQDRVRFSFAGRTFEVLLGESTAGE